MRISKKLIARELIYILLLIIIIGALAIQQNMFSTSYAVESVLAFILYAYLIIVYAIRLIIAGFKWALKTLKS